jgi:hypothetical protein
MLFVWVAKAGSNFHMMNSTHKLGAVEVGRKRYGFGRPMPRHTPFSKVTRMGPR